MGRGSRNDFIKGKSKSVRIETRPEKVALGYSPVQATASGAGTHGGGKKRRARKARSEARAQIRRGEWD